MKNLLFLLFLTTTLTVTAQRDRNTVTGNNDLTTQTRELDAFKGIEACCNLRVEVTREATQSVRVEGESNLLEYVITEVKNNRLQVRFRENTSIRSKKDIVVYVSVPDINYLSAGSAGKVTLQSEFTGDELELRAESGGSVEARFRGDRVRASADSGGNLDLKGSGREIQVEANSGGQINASNYTVENATAEASSGGSAEINASKKLKAEASSGGRVRHSGKATDIISNASSGGSVRGN